MGRDKEKGSKPAGRKGERAPRQEGGPGEEQNDRSRASTEGPRNTETNRNRQDKRSGSR